VFKACGACHTLSPDDGNRAGPTLHGVMGRKVGTAEGYAYSPALLDKGITWNRETIARLFEIGPNAMLPGTKMPEQVVNRAEDREALVDFIEKATR
jgi:cytochrome c